MPIYTLTAYDINNPDTIPPALVNQVSPHDYRYICDRLNGIEGEACCCGFLIALLLSLFITPLVCFLCPCFVQCRASSERRR
jgi:hypothetical protein